MLLFQLDKTLVFNKKKKSTILSKITANTNYRLEANLFINQSVVNVNSFKVAFLKRKCYGLVFYLSHELKSIFPTNV